MMKVARVAEIKRIDKTAIQEYGISEEILMENAGEAVYQAIKTEINVPGNHFIIFCGIGNNGGDGLVVARKLHSNQGFVTVFLLDDPEKFKGAAKINYEIVQRLEIDMDVITDVDEVQ